MHTLHTQSNGSVETRPWKQLLRSAHGPHVVSSDEATPKLHIYAAQFCLVRRNATSYTQNASHEGNSADRSFTMGGSVPGLIGPVGGPGHTFFTARTSRVRRVFTLSHLGAVLTPQPGTRCGFFSFLGGLGSQKYETIQAKSSLHSIQQKS